MINQSQSAFNHILSDVSLVVFQFEALAGFSAVVDRLGEFSEVSDVKLRHVFTVDAPEGGSSGGGAEGAGGAGAGQQQGAVGSAARPALAAAGDAAGAAAAAGAGGITIVHMGPAPSGGGGGGELLLELRGLCISTPDGSAKLAQNLDLEVRGGGWVAHAPGPGICTRCAWRALTRACPPPHRALQVHAGDSLLIVGPSGAGKTSVLRALAGLWQVRRPACRARRRAYAMRLASAAHAPAGECPMRTPLPPTRRPQAGSGSILSHGLPGLGDPGCQPGSVLFLPQRPYMTLGSLRDQLLYPTWSERGGADGNGGGSATSSSGANGASASAAGAPPPGEAELEAVLARCSSHRCWTAAARPWPPRRAVVRLMARPQAAAASASAAAAAARWTVSRTGPRCCRWASSSASRSRGCCSRGRGSRCWTRPPARWTSLTRRCCTRRGPRRGAGGGGSGGAWGSQAAHAVAHAAAMSCGHDAASVRAAPMRRHARRASPRRRRCSTRAWR